MGTGHPPQTDHPTTERAEPTGRTKSRGIGPPPQGGGNEVWWLTHYSLWWGRRPWPYPSLTHAYGRPSSSSSSGAGGPHDACASIAWGLSTKHGTVGSDRPDSQHRTILSDPSISYSCAGPTVLLPVVGDTVVDGAVTNRVTSAQTRKKTVTNACQVHLIGFCEFSCFSPLH